MRLIVAIPTAGRRQVIAPTVRDIALYIRSGSTGEWHGHCGSDRGPQSSHLLPENPVQKERAPDTCRGNRAVRGGLCAGCNPRSSPVSQLRVGGRGYICSVCREETQHKMRVR